MLRGEYSVNPNSRYSSAYGSYYYMLQLLRDVSGLVRAGVPNQKIGPERVTNIDLGVDFSLLGDKFTLSADIFEEYTRHMIVDTKASPSTVPASSIRTAVRCVRAVRKSAPVRCSWAASSAGASAVTSPTTKPAS